MAFCMMVGVTFKCLQEQQEEEEVPMAIKCWPRNPLNSLFNFTLSSSCQALSLPPPQRSWRVIECRGNWVSIRPGDSAFEFRIVHRSLWCLSTWRSRLHPVLPVLIYSLVHNVFLIIIYRANKSVTLQVPCDSDKWTLVGHHHQCLLLLLTHSPLLWKGGQWRVWQIQNGRR